MGPERTPERPSGFGERLRAAARATGRTVVEILEAIKEFDRTHRVDDAPKEEKPSGWMDPDDPDIGFLHNGAPYNR